MRVWRGRLGLNNIRGLGRSNQVSQAAQVGQLRTCTLRYGLNHAVCFREDEASSSVRVGLNRASYSSFISFGASGWSFSSHRVTFLASGKKNGPPWHMRRRCLRAFRLLQWEFRSSGLRLARLDVPRSIAALLAAKRGNGAGTREAVCRLDLGTVFLPHPIARSTNDCQRLLFSTSARVRLSGGAGSVLPNLSRASR